MGVLAARSGLTQSEATNLLRKGMWPQRKTLSRAGSREEERERGHPLEKMEHTHPGAIPLPLRFALFRSVGSDVISDAYIQGGWSILSNCLRNIPTVTPRKVVGNCFKASLTHV